MVFTACLCVQSGAAIHNINTVCILLCMDVYVYARTCVHVCTRVLCTNCTRVHRVLSNNGGWDRFVPVVF